MDLLDIRRNFPITATEHVYLDHAAKSPMTTVAVEAAQEYLSTRTSDDVLYFPQSFEDRAQAIELLANLINGDAERMGFMGATSEGLNMLVDSLAWKAGDEVIVFAKDFPANVYPFLKLQDRFGVKVKVVPDQNYVYTTEDYLELITPKTKLLAVSFVSFLTGQVADLEQIGKVCKEQGIIFSVDTIQGVGGIQLDVKKCHIDFVANGGHKWMLFPQGTGFFYYSERMEELFVDGRHGWLDREVPFDLFNWNQARVKGAGRFFLGTGNDLGVYLALKVMQFRASIGETNIAERIVDHGRYLKQALLERKADLISPADAPSGIVTLRVNDAEAVRQKLLEKQITVSERGGLLRISPHFYNTREELDRFLWAFDEVIRV